MTGSIELCTDASIFDDDKLWRLCSRIIFCWITSKCFLVLCCHFFTVLIKNSAWISTSRLDWPMKVTNSSYHLWNCVSVRNKYVCQQKKINMLLTSVFALLLPLDLGFSITTSLLGDLRAIDDLVARCSTEILTPHLFLLGVNVFAMILNRCKLCERRCDAKMNVHNNQTVLYIETINYQHIWRLCVVLWIHWRSNGGAFIFIRSQHKRRHLKISFNILLKIVNNGEYTGGDWQWRWNRI